MFCEHMDSARTTELVEIQVTPDFAVDSRMTPWASLDCNLFRCCVCCRQLELRFVEVRIVISFPLVPAPDDANRAFILTCFERMVELCTTLAAGVLAAYFRPHPDRVSLSPALSRRIQNLAESDLIVLQGRMVGAGDVSLYFAH